MEKKIIDGKEWICYSEEDKQKMRQFAEKAKNGQLTEADIENFIGGGHHTQCLARSVVVCH